MGFYKLEFYSPQNFRMFSPVLRFSGGTGYVSCGGMPDPPGNSG